MYGLFFCSGFAVLAVYPYGLRFMSWLAIDGLPVIDPNHRAQAIVLERLLQVPDDPSAVRSFSIEDNDPSRQRLPRRPMITNEEMGTEWRV
jgi:hypothetical protein